MNFLLTYILVFLPPPYYLLPHTPHFRPPPPLPLVVRVLPDDCSLLWYMRRFRDIYLYMAWNIYLDMEWNILLKIARNILLEMNIFKFYRDHLFPFWLWCYKDILLREFLKFYDKIESWIFEISILRVGRIDMVSFFASPLMLYRVFYGGSLRS